ncbi:MAG: hypothetical protein ACRDPE_18380 [Solirubrobacterales bacterium]
MTEKARSADNLVVREHHGVRTFSITWQAGRRRHRLRLGSERECLGERAAATAVRLILAWPAPPTRESVDTVVRWVLARERERARGQA